jgi:transcriptional regulator with XRE-family HTH domain
MTINPVLKIIRAKKLGVLIRDARVKSGKTIEECARAMGISADEMPAIEFGERPATLPELEILAYYLEVPLDHFWGNQALKTDGDEKSFDPEEIKQIRQNVIGALIRKARIEAVLSEEELADKAGITVTTLQSYEQGEVPIPLPELEILSLVLNNSVANFEDQEGLMGSWFVEQRNMREFLVLPKELQEFIGKPVNRPYLDLAIKLSELKVERLRALAEGLLEITL